MTILPPDFPPELAAMFNAPRRSPPRDPVSDHAAQTGTVTQWTPTNTDPNPPF